MNFIADFMCKELMLIIEIDGFSHGFEKQWELDQARQQQLEDAGFTVLRFEEQQVLRDLDNVSRSIEAWVLDHPPTPPSKGE